MVPKDVHIHIPTWEYVILTYKGTLCSIRNKQIKTQQMEATKYK